MLNTFAEIRPAERRSTYAALTTLFGIMAGHALLETARDALFLARIPAARLPYVYIAIVLVSFFIFTVQQRTGTSVRNRQSLSLWLFGSAVATAGFWFLVGRPDVWILYAVYIWSGVFATLVIIRFWTLVGDLFTVGQAKRLFALIGAGSVTGAIAGAGFARLLTTGFDARHLLLAAAGMFLLSGLGPLLLMPDAHTDRSDAKSETKLSQSDLKRQLKTAWQSPYLRRIWWIVLLSTITLTLVDFVFKSTVAREVAAEQLGSFFAGAYLVLNLLSLLVQVLFVGWIVRSFGIHRVLSILPALLAAGGLAVLLGGGLIAAFVLKVFDGSLRHSLHRTAMEVLYVPLTGDLRSRVRGFIDLIGQRGGQAIASILILLTVAVGLSEGILAIFVLGLAIVWIAVATTLRDHYLNLFRENLNEVALRTRFAFPELDLASLETLMTGLNSPNDAEVVAACELLAEQGRVRLIPALILYHPSTLVVIRALELFATEGRTDFLPMTERLLEHEDPEIRAATLRTRAWVAPSVEIYEKFIDDPSPVVKTTALLGCVSYGTKASSEAIASIRRIAESGSDQEKLALAHAIRYSPGASYEEPLATLAESDNPAVRLAAARAMQEILSPRFIPKLLGMLTDRDLRAQAQTTLVAIGTEALNRLDATLENPYCDPRIRRQVPRVIGLFSPGEAAPILLKHFLKESDGAVRYGILRTLGRLRAANPTLPLDESILWDAVRQTVGNSFRLINSRFLLDEGAARQPARRTEAQEAMVALLEHKEQLALERLFRLLGLLHPDEDLRSIYRGVRSKNRSIRASSQELLENLLRPPLRESIVALIDEIDDNTKLERTGPFHQRFRYGYEGLLRYLLEQSGVGMRSLVICQVGDLRLQRLREEIERVPHDLGGLIATTVQRTLPLLAAPAPEGVSDGR